MSRKRLQRLMRLMGLLSVAPRPYASRRTPGHVSLHVSAGRCEGDAAPKRFGVSMAHGFHYVVTIMDGTSGKC